MDDILRQCHVHEITHVWPLSTEDQLIMALESSTRLRDHVVIASPVDVVEFANDQIRLYERCAARGLPVPGYRIIDDVAALLRAAGEHGHPKKPVVLKAALGTGAAGLKIIRPNMSRLEMFHSRLNRDVDLETAAAQLDGVSPWPSLMLTEYLPREEFGVDVLRFRGVWKGGVVRRRDESLFGDRCDGGRPPRRARAGTSGGGGRGRRVREQRAVPGIRGRTSSPDGDQSARAGHHRSQCRGGKQPPRGCAGTGGGQGRQPVATSHRHAHDPLLPRYGAAGMSDLTAVIFDFDGTLVQLRPGPGQMDELRERLGALFAEVGIRSTLRPFYPEVDRALAAPRHLDDALRRRAVALIEEYELEFSRSSEPCPHAAQTWKAVASRFPCAVSSRNTRLAVHRTLSRHGIWDPRTSVPLVGFEDVERHKPDPASGRGAASPGSWRRRGSRG
jgi:hypothetical protein